MHSSGDQNRRSAACAAGVWALAMRPLPAHSRVPACHCCHSVASAVRVLVNSDHHCSDLRPRATPQCQLMTAKWPQELERALKKNKKFRSDRREVSFKGKQACLDSLLLSMPSAFRFAKYFQLGTVQEGKPRVRTVVYRSAVLKHPDTQLGGACIVTHSKPPAGAFIATRASPSAQTGAARRCRRYSSSRQLRSAGTCPTHSSRQAGWACRPFPSTCMHSAHATSDLIACSSASAGL